MNYLSITPPTETFKPDEACGLTPEDVAFLAAVAEPTQCARYIGFNANQRATMRELYSALSPADKERASRFAIAPTPVRSPWEMICAAFRRVVRYRVHSLVARGVRRGAKTRREASGARRVRTRREATGRSPSGSDDAPGAGPCPGPTSADHDAHPVEAAR